MQVGLDELQAMVAKCRMVEFVAALRASGLQDLMHVPFNDEDHGSVAPAALVRGLTFALDTWRSSQVGP